MELFEALMLSLYFYSLNTCLPELSSSPPEREKETEGKGRKGRTEGRDKQMINLASLNSESERGKTGRKNERNKDKQIINLLNSRERKKADKHDKPDNLEL